MENQETRCQGACSKHDDCYGDVLRYEIVDAPINNRLWVGLKFNYCQEAVKIDTESGFVLEEIGTE